MEEVLLAIIARIQGAKEAERIVPVDALFIADIMPAVKEVVKEELNRLVKEKRLVWHRTINDDSFRIL